LLASHLGIRWTALILASPALLVAGLEILMWPTPRAWLKGRMRAWDAHRQSRLKAIPADTPVTTVSPASAQRQIYLRINRLFAAPSFRLWH
jgi:hypothetical protein